MTNTTLALVLIFISFSNLLLGSEIKQSSAATADSKSKACQQALLQAQEKALHQSGINIFTKFEYKKTITDNQVKKIINTNLQSSYGSITTISKDEQVSFNQSTGYITCNVDGVFDVDTTKLKSQMLALSKKYENQYEEENRREKALEKKNILMQKYIALKNSITQSHTFHYAGNHGCSENITIKECKKQFNSKLTLFFKDKLSKKYNIDLKLITLADVKKLENFQSKVTDNITLSYDGKLNGKALSIENPYLNEINSINIFLGQKKILKPTKIKENLKLSDEYLFVKENYLSLDDKNKLIQNNTLIKINAYEKISFSSIYLIPVDHDLDAFNGRDKVLNLLVNKMLKKYNGDFLLNITLRDETNYNILLQGQMYILRADVYKKGKL